MVCFDMATDESGRARCQLSLVVNESQEMAARLRREADCWADCEVTMEGVLPLVTVVG
jgi:hypothetical protein